MTADTDKPKRPAGKLGAEMPTPAAQRARTAVAEAQAVVASAKIAARAARSRASKAAADVKASKAALGKAVGKLGAEKLTPEEQHRRFVEAARASGASEDVADFNTIIRRIAKPKAPSEAGR